MEAVQIGYYSIPFFGLQAFQGPGQRLDGKSKTKKSIPSPPQKLVKR